MKYFNENKYIFSFIKDKYFIIVQIVKIVKIVQLF